MCVVCAAAELLQSTLLLSWVLAVSLQPVLIVRIEQLSKSTPPICHSTVSILSPVSSQYFVNRRHVQVATTPTTAGKSSTKVGEGACLLKTTARRVLGNPALHPQAQQDSVSHGAQHRQQHMIHISTASGTPRAHAYQCARLPPNDIAPNRTRWLNPSHSYGQPVQHHHQCHILCFGPTFTSSSYFNLLARIFREVGCSRIVSFWLDQGTGVDPTHKPNPNPNPDPDSTTGQTQTRLCRSVPLSHRTRKVTADSEERSADDAYAIIKTKPTFNILADRL